MSVYDPNRSVPTYPYTYPSPPTISPRPAETHTHYHFDTGQLGRIEVLLREIVELLKAKDDGR